MNVEEIVGEVMENDFRSWQPAGSGYWVSRRLDTIQDYRVESSRYGFAKHIEFENVPELIKPKNPFLETDYPDLLSGSSGIRIPVIGGIMIGELKTIIKMRWKRHQERTAFYAIKWCV